MERESFEDESVAAALNRDFVSIKVDREERPDVDSFYMDACLTAGSAGGWPLSCFLTHNKTLFFGGTYFPKNDGLYGIGFLTLLQHVVRTWKNDRPGLIRYAGSITRLLEQQAENSSIDPESIHAAFRQIKGRYDKRYGGFGNAPKFPSPHQLLFLMRYGMEYHEKQAFEMVRNTLDGMYRGGIYDHIGGGFARYSTDEKWLVPHFEKMMTDNAMHIMAYSEAAALFGGDYARIAREVTEFCMREMRDEAGGFYTALDADSEGAEGKYYVFSPDEVKSVLGQEDGNRYCGLYGITKQGNFEGWSIPNLIAGGLPEAETQFARSCNEKMLQYRAGRTPPFRDDKVLTMVSGLMIAALALESRILHDKNAADAAERCADFLLGSMIINGRLQSRYRAGEVGIPANSDDYACLIWGLIELYETTLSPKWLAKAVEMTDEMKMLFWDSAAGGYFLAGSDVEELPVRQKILHDGALPSGNSVMAQNLMRLARITANSSYEEAADQIFCHAANMSRNQPMALTFLLCALMHRKNGGTEVVLANGNGFYDLKNALPDLLMFTTVAACGEGFEGVLAAAPYLEQYSPVNGKAAAYVCRGGSCQPPVTSKTQLAERLRPAQH